MLPMTDSPTLRGKTPVMFHANGKVSWKRRNTHLPHPCPAEAQVVTWEMFSMDCSIFKRKILSE